MNVRNVTIALDEETARWARVEAAQRDMSLSRFIGDLLRERRETERSYEEAMKSFLSRKPYLLGKKGSRYPTKDEIHDRAALR